MSIDKALSKVYLLAMVPVLLAACEQKTPPTAAETDAPRLYAEQVRLLDSYTAKMRAAVDSADIELVFNQLNSRIDSINHTVAPDTDLQLSEAQNDTLLQKMNAFLEAKNNRLKGLGRRDTIPEEETDVKREE